MTSFPRLLLVTLGVCLLALAGCRPDNPPTCGDGKVDQGEQCDDGNNINGDGCDNDCHVSADGGTDAGNPGTDGGTVDAGNPGTDAGETGTDAGNPGADAGETGTDAGNPGADAGETGSDAGMPGADAGETGSDAGMPGADAGDTGSDAGTPGADAGDTGSDGGTSGGGTDSDAGMPGSDAGDTGSDAGVPGSDAGDTGSDAGVPGSDAGDTGSDAGVPGSDAGDTGSDAGVPGSDAGDTGSDAGTPGSDAGDTGSDAGSSDAGIIVGICGNGVVDPGEVCDDGNTDNNDSCTNNCTLETITCPALPAPPTGSSCGVTAGTSGTLYLGTVLGDGRVYVNGGVLVDASGTIQYVGCGYASAPGASAATQVSCPQAVISPGLINSHDHITFQATPYVEPTYPDGGYIGERYEQRHDWRTGKNGHTSIDNYDPPQSGSTNDQIRWGELRQVMAGTTSVAGSGGQDGLLRNLDKGTSPSTSSGWQEAPFTSGPHAFFDTFPLGDTSGTQLASGCGYASLPNPSTDVTPNASYLPHIAEGIRVDAHNEFLCMSGQQTGSVDILSNKTAVIHAVGLTGTDIGLMGSRHSTLVWSPRSNISLYGDTALVTAFHHTGVNIALGTDWVRSGSMNLLRELKCADYLNQVAYGTDFSDYQLWRLVTANAADGLGFEDKLGRLAPGYVADLAIFNLGGAPHPHRAVIAANPEDVLLTVRGGKVLYGDSGVISALGTAGCTALSGLGTAQSCLNGAKTVCLDLDNAESSSTLRAANASTYPLAFCGGATPDHEPTCRPERLSMDPRFPASVNGSHPYSIAATLPPPANDLDDDGVTDDVDNCPGLFNPIRPMDDGKQMDSDGDGVGDACDACPTDPTTAIGPCHPFDPNDVDGDGVPNATDNCRFQANPSQADTDGDGKGDTCNLCPNDANPGTLLCPGTPATLYDLKTPIGGGTYPLLNQQVRVRNLIVTAVVPTGFTSANTFFAQERSGPADYSGIYVFRSTTAAPPLSPGDVIDIDTVRFQFFSGELELSSPQTVTKVSTGTPPSPVPVTGAQVADGGARAAALEGVVVDVAPGATVVSVDTSNKEFTLSDGLIVGQFLSSFPLPTVGQGVATLRGVLALRGGHYKVEPRAAADFAVETVHLTGFGPDGQYIRTGATSVTFPQPLTLSLDAAPDHPVTVSLTSSAPTDLQVANVTLPAGTMSVPIMLTAVNPNPDVTLTAVFNGTTLTAHVHVLDSSAVAHLASITPSIAVVPLAGTATFMVSLDTPAPAPTDVTFSLVPSMSGGVVGSLSATTVTIPPNGTSASVTFTPDASPTDNLAHLVASSGSDTLSATVALQVGPTRLVSVTPVPSTLVPGGAGVLRLTFNIAPTSDFTVTLGASDPSFFQESFPMTVVVPGGSGATYDVPVTASAVANGTVSVLASANAGADLAQTSVTVAQPALVDLTPHSTTTAPGNTLTFTVTLAPAPALATPVALSVPTPFFTSSPTSVTVPANSATATFQLTVAGTATGTAQVTATLGGVTRQAQVTAAGATHVVISEICGGVTGATRDEFIELYNPTGSAVDLTGWTVQYKSAAGTSYSGSVTISGGSAPHMIAAHGYFLLVGGQYAGSVAGDATYSFDMSASTSAGGHVRIGPGLVGSNVNDPNTVDKIGWGTGDSPEGSAAPSHPASGGSLERKAFASSTSATMGPGGSDATAGNSYDSDNNATDFVQRSARDPQNSTMHEP